MEVRMEQLQVQLERLNVVTLAEMLHKQNRKRRAVTTPIYNERQMALNASRSRVGIVARKRLKKEGQSREQKEYKPPWSKATTTPIVNEAFESFFTHQLDNVNNREKNKCGVCLSCQLPDCGMCTPCKNMVKFGGLGTTKVCKKRKCQMTPENRKRCQYDNDISESDDNEDHPQEEQISVKRQFMINKRFKWLGEPLKVEGDLIYYQQVEIEGAMYTVKDYVIVETEEPHVPSLVARISFMWNEKRTPTYGYFHAEVFMHATDTVLGEAGDPREVFLADRCCHRTPITSILRPASVLRKQITNYYEWLKLKGSKEDRGYREDDGKTYFYQKFYDRYSAKFESLPEEPVCPNALRQHRYCPSCQRSTLKDWVMLPKVHGKLNEVPGAYKWEQLHYRRHSYKKGHAVFLKPGTFIFDHTISKNIRAKCNKVDESVFTEYYRKNNNSLTCTNLDTREPFCVGLIEDIASRTPGPFVNPLKIFIKVRVLFRPENTNCRFPQREDLNIVYWSERIEEVNADKITGPCFLYHRDNLPHIPNYLEADVRRFYFDQAYDESKKKFTKIPKTAFDVCQEPISCMNNAKINPLRTLDVFSGCGGLSYGLQQAGVANCAWAIDNDKPALEAYQLNHKNCITFNTDCNEFLRNAMDGVKKMLGKRLPLPGEVELLCGGPPCQGFSGMNRFKSSDYSVFKNSLIATYLAFCEFYRPKYFILENVKNFVDYKNGIVLKLTLKCLLKLGYQCTFSILQAGNYGIPQTRRRLIILAAAPGCKLPSYPYPTHVFSRTGSRLTVTVDGKRFVPTLFWNDSAPLRTCTILDAISDLPEIEDGASEIDIEYEKEPESHFQRIVRNQQGVLIDHICKKMPPLTLERIKFIPTSPGSDWRDLPNTQVVLPDGSKSNLLRYTHHDVRNGKSATGALRGVCACAGENQRCDPLHKQDNTLIPWWMPHTANRHNNWAGLFGRLEWGGYFSTTITDPEPMGKQGRVLHPQQNRVVSVRECARSQGFPDTFLFAGSIQDKHRQIGNAVPPPLAAALGRAIITALGHNT